MKREACDLVVTGAKILNVFTGETEAGDIAVADGKIVGVGRGYSAPRTYDAAGKIALPGFIDAHIHVESSLLSPEEFAAVAVPHGTSAVVADPHEIVNVCGIEGAEYLREAFSRLDASGVRPLDVYLQLPSCVPATPFETSGAAIGGRETERELSREIFHGLGEMMNYPAVLSAEEETVRKLAAARSFGKVADGHAPALSGDALNAYLCAGIATDHEALTAKECREKIARGLYIQLRNGSSAHNLEENCGAVNAYNYRRFLICSDDRNARDLSEYGHIDDALRKLVARGIPAVQAVAMATLNTAECYGLKGKGALAPSYDADIVLVNNLTEFRVDAAFKRGTLVAEKGKALFAHDKKYLPDCIRNTVRIGNVSEERFCIRTRSGKLRAMRVAPRGLVTEEEIVPVTSADGDIVLEHTDLCKLAVVERHFASGNIGLGLVKGYGLKGGAIGITVAHDSHNLVVMGDNNADMVRICALLQKSGGGMALVCGREERVFPLDIGGLMSSMSADAVIKNTAELSRRAHEMGVKEYYEPFMTLAFLSLAVIPKLKLTDMGLFDVEKFAFTNLEAEA